MSRGVCVGVGVAKFTIVVASVVAFVLTHRQASEMAAGINVCLVYTLLSTLALLVIVSRRQKAALPERSGIIFVMQFSRLILCLVVVLVISLLNTISLIDVANVHGLLLLESCPIVASWVDFLIHLYRARRSTGPSSPVVPLATEETHWSTKISSARPKAAGHRNLQSISLHPPAPRVPPIQNCLVQPQPSQPAQPHPPTPATSCRSCRTTVPNSISVVII